ncbi:MAG: hypothetical protein H6Q16_487 [Bacteroidetes bacterium]|nr:hypothetical protein [Bacteroidota bacterium]
MKTLKLILLLFSLSFISCEKEIDDQPTNEENRFVPTDVFVKIKGGYTIDKVFKFINSFDHEVENINSLKFTSSLSPDSLQYVLDYLNAKPYTNDGNVWFVNGYLHYQTNQITIFPRLFNIKNTTYQEDWLNSMKVLKLKEDTISQTAGCIIYFHVPEGEERLWESIFKKYEFVEWVQLNYYSDIILLNNKNR